MGQILRLVVIAIVIWLAIQLLRRAFAPRPRNNEKQTASGDAPRMLPCAHCGVHIPETQALLLRGKAYCSKEHLPST